MKIEATDLPEFEIVTCEQCKHGAKCISSDGYVECRNRDSECHAHMHRLTWFCGDGEKNNEVISGSN